jgi:hypothetical protein
VSLSVTATGANLTYQWNRNGTPISGARSSTYSFQASAPTAGNYTVRVSNPIGNSTSSPAEISLRPAAEWTWTNNGPTNPVQIGGSATFSVGNVVGPGTITYQWLKNGQTMSGRTGTSLTLNPLNLSDGGIYNLSIRTSAGTITTESRTLIVQDPSLVVYSINATGNSTIGTSRQTTNFSGFLVRERLSGVSHFFWLDNGRKTSIYEKRTDLTEKSTGPFVGSASVLSGYTGNFGNSPDEEMLWFSGTDALTNLNNSLRTLAPSRMTGQINSVIQENGTTIEIMNVFLTLDTAQTLRARTTDQNPEATISRITNEIKAAGFR